VRELDELDAVSWRDLEHAYDNAADVPELLRALGDGDLEVLGDLFGALCHQGRRFSASAPVVPFIAGILAAGQVDAVSLLMTLGALAVGDEDVYAFPRPPEADGAMDADAVAAYRAVEAELPVAAGFVGSADPPTSAAASWLLSWFPDRAATSLPVVLAAPSSSTRTLAAGLLGHVPGERGEWCAAVAAVCAGDASAYDEVVRFARTMKGAALVDESVPYLFGNVAAILAGAVASRPGPDAARVIRVLVDRAEPGRRHAVRYFLDKAEGRLPVLEDGPR
jgi:hypothetical protein